MLWGIVGHMQPNTTTAEPVLLSIQEAARALSLSTWTVYQLADSSRLASVYQGRRRYIPMASIRAYVEALPTEPPTEATG